MRPCRWTSTRTAEFDTIYPAFSGAGDNSDSCFLAFRSFTRTWRLCPRTVNSHWVRACDSPHPRNRRRFRRSLKSSYDVQAQRAVVCIAQAGGVQRRRPGATNPRNCERANGLTFVGTPFASVRLPGFVPPSTRSLPRSTAPCKLPGRWPSTSGHFFGTQPSPDRLGYSNGQTFGPFPRRSAAHDTSPSTG